MQTAIYPSLQATKAAEAATPHSVVALLEQYEAIESMCEEDIARRDSLARQAYAKKPDETEAGAKVGEFCFDRFRQRHGLAAKLVPAGLPGAARRFMARASAHGLSEIEGLEERIRQHRCQMDQIEHDILELVPITARDAAAKLSFMACLMLDGGNLEVDFFAYLVEECAAIVASELRTT